MSVQTGKGSEDRRKHNVLITNLDQTQPRHIPASIGPRVTSYPSHSIAQHVGAHGVVWRETAQLDQELAAAHVVGPGRCHGLLERRGVGLVVAGRGHLFDAPQLRQRVDAVCAQGLDELCVGGLFLKPSVRSQCCYSNSNLV